MSEEQIADALKDAEALQRISGSVRLRPDATVMKLARLALAMLSSRQADIREARAEAIGRFRAIVEEHLEHRGQEAGPEGYHKVVSCLAMVRVAITDYEQELGRDESLNG